MRVAVVRFPGSNCEPEACRAVERAGAQAFYVWHRDSDLQQADAVLLPGGFSYGDYLRSGAIARFSPIMEALRRHAEAGGPVLGICNGFQILCEAGLLPGALVRNAGLKYLSRPVDVRIERTETPFTSAYHKGEVIRIPIGHGDGRYVAPPALLDELEQQQQIVLRYTGSTSEATPYNPNASLRDIAAVCNREGNVVGMMPHPERLADLTLGSEAGHRVFVSLVSSLVRGEREDVQPIAHSP
ncbi:MAG TPA: phosphoribosylformylglycinamidine synthase subunit PurQ [Gemmatimonadales bacterium]|jgi:phosphoribosylformylglycinamidine synthase|nr:phosphoribosylformylglycinamidine synthase subunit PurQ [Gemmatimonadales bacterium]